MPKVSAKKPAKKRVPATRGGGKALVVVESPAKAKTINRYLGEGYLVKYSLGHIKDLPKKYLGVEVKKKFRPTYEPIPSKRKLIAELKNLKG